jgi:hypothetical protein
MMTIGNCSLLRSDQNTDAFTDITVGSNKVGRGGEKLAYGTETAVFGAVSFCKNQSLSKTGSGQTEKEIDKETACFRRLELLHWLGSCDWCRHSTLRQAAGCCDEVNQYNVSVCCCLLSNERYVNVCMRLSGAPSMNSQVHCLKVRYSVMHIVPSNGAIVPSIGAIVPSIGAMKQSGERRAESRDQAHGLGRSSGRQESPASKLKLANSIEAFRSTVVLSSPRPDSLCKRARVLAQ